MLEHDFTIKHSDLTSDYNEYGWVKKTDHKALWP